MSYSVYFKNIPSEVMEKYNRKDVNNSKEGNILFSNNDKLPIKVLTLKQDNDEDIVNSVKKAEFAIKLNLMGIEREIEAEEELFAYNMWKEEGGYVHYSGREYSHDEPSVSREFLFDNTVETLILLKYCTKDSDYFNSDSNFFEKVEKIDEVLDEFEFEIRDIKRFEIMKDLKEYREEDDDSDLK